METVLLDDLKMYQNEILSRENVRLRTANSILCRYKYPVLTKEHIPLMWRYDFDTERNPFMEERIGVNAVMNSGAIKLNGKYYLMVRVEGMTVNHILR